MVGLMKCVLVFVVMIGGLFGVVVVQVVLKEDLKGINVVFVYGVFVDGLSWNCVILLLEVCGLYVVLVQNLLSLFVDDVVVVKCMIDEQKGLVVLVGYLWVGVVISDVGNDDKVKLFVYVVVFVFDNGQLIVDVMQGLLVLVWVGELCKDVGGFVWLLDKVIVQDFVLDLLFVQQCFVVVIQGLWYGGCILEKVMQVVWYVKLLMFVVVMQDWMIDLMLQEVMVKWIGVMVMCVNVSYVVMLSQLKVVVDVIIVVVECVKQDMQ